ncbi:MAG: hypothetical protein KGJ02_05895 [Verrucomicrobiota bacterium]|nr:hypothetical protein [Verrucomicrobiota bacterium]
MRRASDPNEYKYERAWNVYNYESQLWSLSNCITELEKKLRERRQLYPNEKDFFGEQIQQCLRRLIFLREESPPLYKKEDENASQLQNRIRRLSNQVNPPPFSAVDCFAICLLPFALLIGCCRARPKQEDLSEDFA